MPENIKLVDAENVKSWRVEDRQKYIEKVVMDILKVNSDKGTTIEDLAVSTKFNRRTISHHLEVFVTRGEAYKELRGRLQIFRANGKPIGKPELVNSETDGHYFKLYKLENPYGNFVYVQERQIDDFKRDNVKSVIKIKDSEIQNFIKQLHTFAVRAMTDE